MIYDFQRASMLKRMMAWLLDFIVVITLMVGCMWGLVQVVDIDTSYYAVSADIDKYEAQYGGKLTIPSDQLAAMTAEEQAAAQELSNQINVALYNDPEAVKHLETLISQGLLIISLSFLGAYLVWELIIPLLLKNGQTLGKKCFGIALMRKDGVKVTPFMMFARTILGKFTIETMLPIMILISFLNSFGLLVAGCFWVAQIVIPIATRNKTAIHDLMACTVAVDLASQMIFDSPEEVVEYHQRIHEEVANKADY